MIAYNDVKEIIDSLKSDGIDVRVRDVAYLILCDTFSDKTIPEKVVYKANDIPTSETLAALSEKLKPFGIGEINTISKDENREELLKLLNRIQDGERAGLIDPKDAIKIEADIRVKLNDKFNIEEEDTKKRIIVVPQKHDIICPHTNRECTYMPSKEACKKHYKLIEIER